MLLCTFNFIILKKQAVLLTICVWLTLPPMLDLNKKN